MNFNNCIRSCNYGDSGAREQVSHPRDSLRSPWGPSPRPGSLFLGGLVLGSLPVYCCPVASSLRFLASLTFFLYLHLSVFSKTPSPPLVLFLSRKITCFIYLFLFILHVCWIIILAHVLVTLTGWWAESMISHQAREDKTSNLVSLHFNKELVCWPSYISNSYKTKRRW